MQDGAIRKTLKAAARAVYRFDLALTRRLQQRRDPPRFRLEGSCQGCGRCCEEPSMQVGRVVWHLRSLRALFVAWQQHINGFALLRAERGRVLVFRCTHYDPTTKLCDSYESRPEMCRDYPRGLLDQPWPEFFDECTYRPVDIRAWALKEALAQTALSEEKQAEVRRRLHLD